VSDPYDLLCSYPQPMARNLRASSVSRVPRLLRGVETLLHAVSDSLPPGPAAGPAGTLYEVRYEPPVRQVPDGVSFGPVLDGEHQAVAELMSLARGQDCPVAPAGAELAVARMGKRVVAYCAFRRSPTGEVWVDDVGVHPCLARRRIGRRLVASVVPPGGAALGVVPAADRRLVRIVLDAGAVVRRSRPGTFAPRDPAVSGAAASLDVSVVRLDDDLAAEWDRLATETAADVFARPGWLRAWAEGFTEGSLHCVTARRHGRLVGLIPVQQREPILLRRSALRSATNDETPRLTPLFIDPSVAGAAVTELRRRWGRVTLEFLPAGSDPVLPFEEAEGALVREIRSSPSIRTDQGGYDTWVEQRLSKRGRLNLNRMGRRLAERGKVSFELVHGSDRLAELLEEGFALESSGWKGRMGTDVLGRDGARRFYWRAAAWAADEDRLRLGFLRVDGRAVAFGYVLRDREVMSLLKLAFDEEFKPCGPGLLLLHRLIAASFEDDCIARFDFLGESEGFKTALADDSERQIRVDLFGPGPIPAARRTARRAVWAARREFARRVPVETRVRVDLSGPVPAVRSAAAVGRDLLNNSLGRRVGPAPEGSRPAGRGDEREGR
jgi:CelD/BcsL family acetyltransferase involved in cellulose biosynthesis